MLEPLDEPQRARLVTAMAEVERLLLASSIAIGVEDPESEDARWCIQQYFAEIGRRFENGFEPAQSLPPCLFLFELGAARAVAQLDAVALSNLQLQMGRARNEVVASPAGRR